MAPQISRTPPPYMQVAQSIRDQIASGQLKDGDRIPSARAIAKEWNVSHATAAKVLTQLQSEGLVRGVQGSGTVVCAGENSHETARDRVTSIKRTGRIYPQGQQARIVAADLVSAPDQVASALGVSVGAPVIRRQRVTYRGDEAVSTSVSWFDGSLAKAAPLLLRAERLPQGTPMYIQESTGREGVSGRDQVAARAATDEDAEVLGVPAGSPVRCGRNWVYDTDGGVIEYGESVSLPERWASYDYKIEREQNA
ncbi:GntR family transcriptional regulator [Actinocatenispora rupis]|uniref:GntR family transcriptional regulator n=1 Tax=Actinocatenispora rupis TaxID=519421 RepID=A0A8J3JFT0_9ACTN|nr:GntR family transcriptional regulator [Actinocatenispora rupis]GID14088.1 GntR family transcriptional regulator [Actinocatenispora rupis]